MTILVAYTDGVSTWIGSDRAYIDGSFMVLGEGKWLQHDGWGLALCGVHRQSAVLAAHKSEILGGLETPLDLSLRLARMFRRYGISPHVEENDRVEVWGCSGILVRGGEVWDLDTALTPMRMPKGRLLGRGYGDAYAEGAAWALIERGYYDGSVHVSAETLVKYAVEAACSFCPGQCAGLWQGKL